MWLCFRVHVLAVMHFDIAWNGGMGCAGSLGADSDGAHVRTGLLELKVLA